MKDTLRVVNDMRSAGVIGNYAIGGAIGATFYIEPTATFDIDIFISFENSPGSILVSLEPIYAYLRQRGYNPEHEHVMVGNWQVQFLPADDPLHSEALKQAVETSFDGVKTWVMTAEHLMVIALKTGRGKDFVRIEHFVTSNVYDKKRLQDILARHGLTGKWKDFTDKYLSNEPTIRKTIGRQAAGKTSTN